MKSGDIMKLQTKFFGEIEFDKKEVVNLPYGMPAFEDEKEFILLPLGDESPFMMFQSVNNEQLCFILAYPFLVNKNYQFELSDEDREFLEIENPKDILCYCVVSVKESFDQSTINLKAPLIINVQSKKGKQIVLHDQDYMIRYPINSPQDKEE